VNFVSSLKDASDAKGHAASHPNPSCLHKGSGRIRHFSSEAILAMAVLLCACEAPLNVSGVEDTLNQPIRRTDQLMVLEHVGETLIMLGNDGLLLRRPIEGEVWQRDQLGDAGNHPDFIGGAVCGDGSLVALSYQADVWHSSDQGESWQTYSLPTGEDVQDIDCTQSNELWVVGSFSTMLHSSAAGQEWEVTTLNEDAMLTAVTFSSSEQGYSAGEFGLLAVTKDAGDSWTVVDLIGDEFYPLAVHFDLAGNGWVGGLQGVIMRSRDGGESWERTDTPTESPIYNFLMVGEKLIATGDQGVILQWSEGSWRKFKTPDIPTYFRAGVALDNQRALIAGGWGVLLPLSLDASL
jgi:photosystem II stability/assembly factor-like uncharacterized protein